MVTSCHLDLLSDYRDAHLLVYNHKIPSYMFKNTIFLLPKYCIHGAWLFFIRGFINGGQDVWPEARFIGMDMVNNVEAWQKFVSRPNIGWILFLLKFPYLIMELIIILLIIKMCSSAESKYKTLNFLMFNPVSLFIIYIFGAYDIVLVLFAVLSFYAAKKQRVYLSVLLLGLSILIKIYTLFLLPLFIMIMAKKWPKRVSLLLLYGISPIIIPLIFAQIKGGLSELLNNAVKFFHGEYLFSLMLPFQHNSDRIYPFIFGYCLIMLYIAHRDSYQENNLFYDLSRYSLSVVLIFYSLCFFHPQYFLLIIPLIAFRIDKDEKIMPLFFVLTLCFFVYTFEWGRDLSGRLFMPVNPEFFANLKSPAELINQIYPADKFIGIFRSVFVAVSFWMIYLLLKTNNSGVKGNKTAKC